MVIKKADPTNDYGVYRCEVEDPDSKVIGTAYSAVTVGYSTPQSLFKNTKNKLTTKIETINTKNLIDTLRAGFNYTGFYMQIFRS